MPTIDELAPAASAGDGDALVISQSGIARRATRAQLLSGVQAALALPAGSLLGRMSPGLGGVEPVMVGANLTVANGVISGAPAFEIAGLRQGGLVQSVDLVPLAQGGENTALDYATFMGGMGRVAGIDGSNLTVAVAGAPRARRIADQFEDGITIASFGAVGDGVTDDTVAFQTAISSGRPIRLDGRSYLVRGALRFASPACLSGVAGLTILRAGSGAVGRWIEVAGTSFTAAGIIFDASGLSDQGIQAVAVDTNCASSSFDACSFLNAPGADAGCGLSILAAEGSHHRISACVMQGNARHGLQVTGSGSVVISDCIARDNSGNGLDIGDGVTARLWANTCSGNTCGVSAGTWHGPAPLQAGGAAVSLEGNTCSGNAGWGIAIAARGAVIVSNILAGNGGLASGGGLLSWIEDSLVSGNIVSGGATGIDCRGSVSSVIDGNMISGTMTGCMAGGCQSVTLSRNRLRNNGWGVVVSAFEPDRSLIPTSSVNVCSNAIAFTASQGGAIAVLDGAQGVSVLGNMMEGAGSATIGQALWLHTDTARVVGNSWNTLARIVVPPTQVESLPAIILPDFADEVTLVGAGGAVPTLLTTRQLDTLGQILFVKVTDGGGGFTRAGVSFGGSGAGAAGSVVVIDGRVAWITMTNAGSGYGPIGASVTVTITGDGHGAAATASAGLPALEGRRLRLVATARVSLITGSSSPPHVSWSGFDVTIPANGAAEIEGLFGRWCSVASLPVDYLMPTGDGGAVLQTISGGDLVLRPAEGGTLTVATSQEPGGYISAMGRGSPEGRIAAPPGSDFRNLDGGAGNTLFLKQVGTTATGWKAIA